MALLLLPNQLFEDALEADQDTVYLVEDVRYFTAFDYHKKKLVLHRASMKYFQERLEQTGCSVEYVDYREGMEAVFEAEDGLEMYDPVDHEVEERVERLAEDQGVELEVMETPAFLTPMDWNREFFSENGFGHREYYIGQRKRLDVLVDDDGSPEGGKWSFDQENREKLPENVQTPDIPGFESGYVEEAKNYVENNFSGNPGDVDGFLYPVTREQARENLENFLEERLESFGPYQDAIDRRLKFGFHSLLSSSLNTGLLTPEEVLEATLDAHGEEDYPMNSLEGFIRQVIGWREYVRMVYELEGEEMRSRNLFGNTNTMPEEFYTGDTGLPPVDVSIQNAAENAYAHHIERLMVLSNVMLLLEIDPDEVCRWFMELFIDAYDWVMVPNVYGMGQYADPRMMTKPYISSSNYIGKMSHYGGGEWEEYWDGLYWRFLDEHRQLLDDNHRMSLVLSQLDSMDSEKLGRKRKKGEEFMESIGGLS